LGTFTVGTEPIGVAFDGANIWVTNLSSANVSKLRASDGTALGTFTPVLPAPGYVAVATQSATAEFDDVVVTQP